MTTFWFLVGIFFAKEIISEYQNRQPLNIPKYISLVINEAEKAITKEFYNVLVLRLELGYDHSLFNDITTEVLGHCSGFPIISHSNEKTIKENLANSLAFVVVSLDSFGHVGTYFFS